MFPFSFWIFFQGLFILLSRSNFIFVLFALELMLLSVNMNFVSGSILLDDFQGQSIALLLFSLAATDTSVGLIILLNYYNLRNVQNLIKILKA